MRAIVRRIRWQAALFSIFGVLVLASVSVYAKAVTQGYKTDQTIARGSVVSLSSESKSEIEKATIENETRLAGVASTDTNALLDIQPEGSDIRVAISGETEILVSTINGDISVGDLLIISPLEGIAARDSNESGAQRFIGTAMDDFNKSSESAKEVEINLDNGEKTKVYVGLVGVKLLLGNRNNSASEANVLTTFGRKLTGKSVSTVQVLTATVVFITTVALAGMVLNGSIRGSFISLGRNPLSKDSIMTGLVRVIIITTVILVAGVAVSYIILLI